MKIFNILNINKELLLNSDLDLIMENEKDKKKQNIKILDFCGKGSYGIVYKCIFDNKICAIKLSKNEKSDLLYKRYKSLKKKLNNSLIKIYYSGKLVNNKNYKYYCIMQFGGISLKEYIKNNLFDIQDVIKQLYNIVENIKNNRLLIPDFKLSNVLIDENNIIILTDIYMDCNEYEPCSGCAIVRTYSVMELSKNIYEDRAYNYTYIYTLFGFALINILCKKSLSYCCEKLSKEYDLDDKKHITLLLQHGCFHCSYYANNEKYNSYFKNKKYSFDIKKFYNSFLNMLSIKNEFNSFINNDELIKLLNNVLLPIYEKRTLENLKV
jgi:serine/threonine protein kinase